MRRGQAEKDVRARQHFGQGPGIGGSRIARHIGQHALATRMDHAVSIGQSDILPRQAHRNQQVNAGQRRSACTRGYQLRVAQRLALEHQRVLHRRRDHDGGAMLVIVKDGNVHPFLKAGFDREAFRRLDILQIDGAERRLQERDGIDEGVGICGIDFDVEHVDIREFLEQDGLAFHHRLGCKSADRAKPQHGRPVGNHRNQIAARGVIERLARVGGDFLARRGDAWRIGQRQIALVDHPLGGLDRQLAGLGMPVVVECAAIEIVVHL